MIDEHQRAQHSTRPTVVDNSPPAPPAELSRPTHGRNMINTVEEAPTVGGMEWIDVLSRLHHARFSVP